MGDDHKVVLRTSLRYPALAILLVVAALEALALRSGDVWFFVPYLVVFSLTILGTGYLRKVVLTSAGLEIRSFGYTLVPWPQISRVVTGGAWWSERYVALTVLPNNRFRKLPAPRSGYGVARGDVEAARDLIERWWLQHRGDPPITPAPVPPDVLWAPPPSG
jgi:hypothetical protein